MNKALMALALLLPLGVAACGEEARKRSRGDQSAAKFHRGCSALRRTEDLPERPDELLTNLHGLP
jgi:hypothetical protein